ncbi:hypothetical protein M8C13_43050 [Crossiella sp. SN42]|uniref:hypothetical protein n=1 Tax=Crossiella sp. SN42 TaxID=2944808 RepID=UPI00207D0C68|nr:hypothetical protein [Crossiella sp. SN42]MCO1582544.1 hypothetical protein [Crossiella sp. SN42]
MVDDTRQSADVLARQALFPGRWVGGISLIAGPLLLLTGALLRSPFHFFFPQQLQAHQQHPALMSAAYACFALGNVLLCFAVIALCQRIAATRPVWAYWGGTLVILGLCTRAYHAGTDQLVFVLADTQGIERAGQLVSDYYRFWGELTWHPFRTFGGAILIGWIVLALGAWRSGVFHPLSALALALMSLHAFGTLKGTQLPVSLIAIGGLTLALAPFGVRLLRDGPRPTRKALIWTAVLAAQLILGVFFAPRG